MTRRPVLDGLAADRAPRSSPALGAFGAGHVRRRPMFPPIGLATSEERAAGASPLDLRPYAV